ncbi:MAG: flagellar protein FlbB [Micavibrio sp.]
MAAKKEQLFGLRILPALMILAALAFGVRFSEFVRHLAAGDAYAAIKEGHDLAGGDLNDFEPAAGDAGTAPPPSQDGLSRTGTRTAQQEQAPPVIEPPSLGGAAGGIAGGASGEAGSPPAAGDWRGPEDLDDQYSDVRMELFADLTKRRRDLDSKEKELVMREALLKAAQAELEQKTQELLAIKEDIEGLLVRQNEEEEGRIASLVKIYEGMKAKDAARIFNTLDMDVLLQVVTRMSERKSAPIIAAMDAEKARNVTIMLAEQNKLPSLPDFPLQR